jgi:hypothetical protein
LLSLLFIFIVASCNSKRQNKHLESQKNEIDVIQITRFNDSLVDATVKKYKLSLDSVDVFTIKQILSDKNPNGDDLNGQDCGNVIKKCKWCNKDFAIVKTYRTYKSKVSEMFSLKGKIDLWVTSLYKGSGEFEDEMHYVAMNFRKGQKHECISADNEGEQMYCSLKCKKESE